MNKLRFLFFGHIGVCVAKVPWKGLLPAVLEDGHKFSFICFMQRTCRYIWKRYWIYISKPLLVWYDNSNNLAPTYDDQMCVHTLAMPYHVELRGAHLSHWPIIMKSCRGSRALLNRGVIKVTSTIKIQILANETEAHAIMWPNSCFPLVLCSCCQWFIDWGFYGQMSFGDASLPIPLEVIIYCHEWRMTKYNNLK